MTLGGLLHSPVLTIKMYRLISGNYLRCCKYSCIHQRNTGAADDLFLLAWLLKVAHAAPFRDILYSSDVETLLPQSRELKQKADLWPLLKHV